MTKLISLPVFFLLLVGCSSTKLGIEDVAKRATILAARPILEKIFYAEAAIIPSNRELFPTVQSIPGKPFDPKKNYASHRWFSEGVVELLPGDYIIPVMSFCMKSSGSSPTSHLYQLGKLSGSAAGIIRDLHAKALLRFQPSDVQATSWSIQNGIPISEMPFESQKIIDAVIPEHRKKLEKSFFQNFSEKWDALAERMGFPRLEEATDQTLNSLGDFGEALQSLREFRRIIRDSSGSYDSLKSLISLPGVSASQGTEVTTPWSRLSGNVYARFLTQGHFLDVGQIQIRVLGAGRGPQSSGSSTQIDIAGLIADPGNGAIQPLSFSPLHASAAISLLAKAHPTIVAAFLAALVATKYIDLEAVGKSIEQWGKSTQNEIKGLIDKLRRVESKEFGDKPGLVKNPPGVPPAFSNLTRVRGKTPRGGGKVRPRWEDSDGNIYDWDYQHGRLEKYDKRGNHLGEYDPNSGLQTKPRDPTRRVEP